MIQESDVKAIERTESLLNLLKEDGDSVFKIISLSKRTKSSSAQNSVAVA